MITCYKNCRKLNEKHELEYCDIYVKDHEICGFSDKPDKVIDMNGSLVTPGLVDLHVHLREPGQTHKEDMITGTKAAANGGFTQIYTMPNVNPVPDSIEKYQAIQTLINDKALVKVEQIAPLTTAISGNTLINFEDYPTNLFSNDGKGVQDANTMYQAMKAISKSGGICIAHTEDESLSQNGVMHRGEKSKALGLEGFNELSETTQIARDIVLAKKANCHYHVCHLSAKDSVKMIEIAQKEGIKVSAEVTPHHLLLNENDVILDSNYKMNPPLRTRADQQALLNGLIDGTIAAIATDHAPHTKEEKDKGFKEAPFGIIGLDFAFPLLYTKLVKTNKLPLHILVERLTDGPRSILREHLEIAPGNCADLAFFDLETSFVLDETFIHSKSKNTPFINEKLQGGCVLCLVSGQAVMNKVKC